MNTKNNIKKIVKKWLSTILLSFCLTNLYAGNENFCPFENSYSKESNSAGFLSSPTSNNNPLNRAPFDSNLSRYNRANDLGGRPGNGEGIGQVPVKDDWIFIAFLIVAYCCGQDINHHEKKHDV